MAVDVAGQSPRLRGSPATAWSLIGRDAEVEALTDLVARSPLVTIVGPGGVGKTALAVEVARRLAPSFADGAAFVGLADLDDLQLVSSEIARSLGLVDFGTGATDRLIAALRGSRMLVVVDNFEHLVEAAPVLADIIAGCPEITLLVTSRRRLGLTAERVVELSPLAVPEATGDRSHVASVALFCTRAAAVNSQFRPDGESLEAIAELCRLVDGLPLAIELVASHVRLLAPGALLARMRTVEHGLGILKGGPVDLAPRHRDLRHTIGWSADLLGSVAARLLPRLSVFRDGWTLEAMEKICCHDLTADEPFEALIELVDLHLVEPVELTDGEPRFRLLETVRRFAGEALTDAGEEEVIRRRHAEFFVEFAVRAGRGLESREEQLWAGRVDRELPNLRVALQHLLATGQDDDGLVAAAALGPYWLDRGVLREGQNWIDRFLPATTFDRVRAVAEGWSVRLALEQADIVASARQDDRDDRLQRALDVVDRAGDIAAWLRLVDHLATSIRLRGRYAEADALLADALARCRTPETAWHRAELLYVRALVADYLGEPERARAVVVEALHAARLAGHDRARARALFTLALVPGTPTPEARSAIEEAFRSSHEVGDRRGMAMIAIGAGRFALEDGDDAAAASWYVQGLDHSLAVGYWRGLGWSVMGIAALAERAGMIAEAARLHGALLTYLQVSNSWVFPARMAYHERVVERLQAALGEGFEQLSRDGARRPWTATIDEARRVLAAVSSGSRPATAPSRRRGPRSNPRLTDREFDVLGALVAGRTNAQIAQQLGISSKTVMHHTVSIYRKLAVRGRAEAVAHALRTGLVTV